jgi:hypothetical protein
MISKGGVFDPITLTKTHLPHTYEELLFEPGDYLEYIPWNELNQLESDVVRLPEDFTELSLSPNHLFLSTATDRTPGLGLRFVSEELILQARLNDYPELENVDGSGTGDHVFLATPVERTSFCSDWYRYWSLWVSCPRLYYGRFHTLGLLQTAHLE